jgi:hypothetical protein
LLKILVVIYFIIHGTKIALFKDEVVMMVKQITGDAEMVLTGIIFNACADRMTEMVTCIARVFGGSSRG